MSELPSDPERLRVILAHLDRQLADTETVGIYLRLQRDAVRRALHAADDSQPPPQPEPPSRPALEAPARQQRTGYAIDRARTPGGAEPSSVHLADCNLVSSLARGVSVEQVRGAIAGGLEACAICRPDTELGILDG